MNLYVELYSSFSGEVREILIFPDFQGASGIFIKTPYLMIDHRQASLICEKLRH